MHIEKNASVQCIFSYKGRGMKYLILSGEGYEIPDRLDGEGYEIPLKSDNGIRTPPPPVNNDNPPMPPINTTNGILIECIVNLYDNRLIIMLIKPFKIK